MSRSPASKASLRNLDSFCFLSILIRGALDSFHHMAVETSNNDIRVAFFHLEAATTRDEQTNDQKFSKEDK